MTSSSPAPACSRRVGRQGSADRATHLLLWLCEGGIFVERALWFGLLDHRDRLVRVPASVTSVPRLVKTRIGPRISFSPGGLSLTLSAPCDL